MWWWIRSSIVNATQTKSCYKNAIWTIRSKTQKKRNAPKSHIKLAFLCGIHYLIKCVMCGIGMARHIMSRHCTLLPAYQKANSKMNQVTLLWSYHKNAILQKVHAMHHRHRHHHQSKKGLIPIPPSIFYLNFLFPSLHANYS